MASTKPYCGIKEKAPKGFHLATINKISNNNNNNVS